jgi:cysteine-rich repeat protein
VAVTNDAVYVASHVPADAGTRLAVARLAAANGIVAWTTPVALSGNVGDEVTGLAISGDTQVVLSARLHDGPTAPDFVVVAFDAASGEETWRVTLDGTASGIDDADGARALAVDGTGHVLATGILSSAASQDDLVVLKLRASDGQEVWRTSAEGSDGGSEDVRDIAVDASGDVVVAARLRNVSTSGDLTAIKFAGATGTLVWTRDIDGTQHGSDTAYNVAIDPQGHVAVAGRLRNGQQGDGYAVARLSGTSGGSWPCGNGVEDPGEECDDANPTAGDGCRTDCTSEACGDGRLDPQEECDDGNLLDDDCCSNACAQEPDGGACDDGDACTESDRCAGGGCVGATPVVCPSAGPCEIGRCDPESGNCLLEVLADGTGCDDGDQCTVADVCGDGACLGGPPPTCDDADPCTADACNATTGCVHPAVLGFDSVLCVFDRGTIGLACSDPLPRALAKRLQKTEALLDRAAGAQRPKAACGRLKRAGLVARKAQRVATRWRDRGRLPFDCGQAIVDQMSFLRARITALRADVC